jgi:hypothetical protein
MLSGEAKREAPAQAELRPTCAGAALSKRQRVEWAFCVNLHLILVCRFKNVIGDPTHLARGLARRLLLVSIRASGRRSPNLP